MPNSNQAKRQIAENNVVIRRNDLITDITDEMYFENKRRPSKSLAEGDENNNHKKIGETTEET